MFIEMSREVPSAFGSCISFPYISFLRKFVVFIAGAVLIDIDGSSGSVVPWSLACPSLGSSGALEQSIILCIRGGMT
jgi:hypothetical protein